MSKPTASYILLYVLAGIAFALPLAGVSESVLPASPAERDGQHDFDFNLGEWHTHIRRIIDPFADAPRALELDGTVSVRKVWGGRAFLEEIEADGPNGRWEGLTLFRGSRGELYGQDTFIDRSILIRAVWSDIRPNSHQYEEFYSADGGRTWSPALIANLTRIR